MIPVTSESHFLLRSGSSVTEATEEITEPSGTPFLGETAVSITGLDIIEEIGKVFQFREQSEVIRFLFKRPEVSSLVLFAYQQLSEFFDLDKVWLEVVHDPEGIEHPHLGLFV